MSLYVDSSAFLKYYIDEEGSELVHQLFTTDPILTTARHSLVEVRRNLSRLLNSNELALIRNNFLKDIESFNIVELDAITCDLAAQIAESLAVRTLDSLHLGAAKRLGIEFKFFTFDVRQAKAARSLGFKVVGS